MPGVLLLVIGVLISMVGGALLTAGLMAAAANQLRDPDGYFTSPTETFGTDLYALTSPSVDRLTVDDEVDDLPFDVATVRLRARSPEGSIFIGIAPMADVERYLDDVSRSELRSLRYSPLDVEYRDVVGSRAPETPTTQDFWAASAAGPGLQQLEWAVTPGDWGVVVMNADAGAAVTAELQVGVRSDLIAPFGSALIAIGALLRSSASRR